MLSILVFLIIFSFLIVIHEFGHFYAAKKSGVKVLEFGLGLGKKLYGKQIGETEFTFNLVPFGGFVRMEGEEENSNDPRSFGKAKLWRRMIITLAGVFMNFVFTIFALVILFSIGSDPIMVSKEDLKYYAEQGFIAFETESGQRLTLDEAKDFAKKVEEKKSKKQEKEGANTQSEKIKIVYLKQIKKSPLESIPFAIHETYRISLAILDKVSAIPSEIIKKHQLPEGMSGPVGIWEVTNKILPQGFLALVKLAAMLSISLGVMNLLPIPALDGGRFFFQIIEMILSPFGVKPNEKMENYAHIGGFMLLMAFLVAVTWSDIMRIFF
jgi:regulator of sigma E protease